MATKSKEEKPKKDFDLWEWLLEKGLLVSAVVINLFLAIVFTLSMLFVIWFTKDH